MMFIKKQTNKITSIQYKIVIFYTFTQILRFAKLVKTLVYDQKDRLFFNTT